jgi:hypothetical protein
MTLGGGGAGSGGGGGGGGGGAGASKKRKRVKVADDVPDAPIFAQHAGGEGGGEGSVGGGDDDDDGGEFMEPWDLERLQNAQTKLQQATVGHDTVKLEVALDALRSGGRMTVELLTVTGLGKEVRALKKNKNASVSSKADALVKAWKAAVVAAAKGQ